MKNPIVRVSQNMEPFMTVLSGMIGMEEQFRTLSGVQIKAARSSMADSLKPVADHYGRMIEKKLDYEAEMAAVSDPYSSVLRHLYAGGNPSNMGNPIKRLFEVRSRKITQGRGVGWETMLIPLPDNDPSVSELTGSSKALERQIDGSFAPTGPDYPAWKERATVVYSRAGSSSGSRGPNEKQYLRYVSPEPDRGTTEIEEVVTASSFYKDYTQYASIFRQWWNKELAVTGREVLEALDISTKKAQRSTLAKLYAEAKSAEGLAASSAAANAALARRSSSTYRTGMFRRGQIQGIYDQKIAARVAERLAKTFEKEVGMEVSRRVKPIPATAAGVVKSKVPTDVLRQREYRQRMEERWNNL